MLLYNNGVVIVGFICWNLMVLLIKVFIRGCFCLGWDFLGVLDVLFVNFGSFWYLDWGDVGVVIDEDWDFFFE